MSKFVDYEDEKIMHLIVLCGNLWCLLLLGIFYPSHFYNLFLHFGRVVFDLFGLILLATGFGLVGMSVIYLIDISQRRTRFTLWLEDNWCVLMALIVISILFGILIFE